ncbi:uncharacterized protein TrAtP1_006883 [Trichoderma atroviride]|uniref:uncharacterized protein n=1 Tax=Hypocrea atroviridis TaxID=63577 RepID=UPI00331C5590|nr:hypothetical protein TrAtP1_006883 [Trichoderma atroviride]
MESYVIFKFYMQWMLCRDAVPNSQYLLASKVKSHNTAEKSPVRFITFSHRPDVLLLTPWSSRNKSLAIFLRRTDKNTSPEAGVITYYLRRQQRIYTAEI